MESLLFTPVVHESQNLAKMERKGSCALEEKDPNNLDKVWHTCYLCGANAKGANGEPPFSVEWMDMAKSLQQMHSLPAPHLQLQTDDGAKPQADQRSKAVQQKNASA
jgi:hypothetical protein